jgi:16S rRNA (guanine527-N7)-methyltransferase
VTAASSPDDPATAVRQLAATWSRPLEVGTTTRLTTFVALMLRWNERINLTGARSANELIGEHLPDAFALAQLVPAGARLVDVGTGGGLPALPFAILRPDVSLTLVEPRAKRVAFLRTALRELHLPADVVPGRVESLDRRFTVASSRATFAPAEWLEKARPLLDPDGQAILFLSGRADLPPQTPIAQALPYQAAGKDRLAVAVQF